ncbi:MAG: hypothetical protein ABJL67_24110 [Sulfitobacter sp.]
MRWLTDDKTLHAANLLVCAGTLITPAGVLAVGTAAVTSALSIKEIAKQLSNAPLPLAGILQKELDTAIATQTHFAGEAKIILPKMIEASLPSAQTIIDTGQKTDALIKEMLNVLHDKNKPGFQPDYILPANVTAFKNIMRPVLDLLLHDPSFTAQLAPLREQITLQMARDMASVKATGENTNDTVHETNRIAQQTLNAVHDVNATIANLTASSRDQLQALASNFGIAETFEYSDVELRTLLTHKATEHRALVKEIESLKGLSARIENIHAAALDAARTQNYAEANQLLEDAREIHTQEILRPAVETNARLLETQADIALLSNKVDQAFTRLSTAADSFASLDPREPARRKILKYSDLLRNHGLRYGGAGLSAAAKLLGPTLDDALKALDPWLWAAGQNNLAAALRNQAIRTDGPKGAHLLAQAVTAYRAALEVYTREDHPVDWAMTQNNLAIALANQAIRTDGAEGAHLLALAVTAYRAALEVRTRECHPVDWAMTQNNLANALRNQAIRTDGAEGAHLLAQAVTAYRAALEVYTRKDHPMDWAMTQNNLAIALADQAIRADGPKGAHLLAQVVTAYRAALEVYTREDHPVQWAGTQNNLANALADQAIRTDGPESAHLLEQAVTAYRAALEVTTREDHPVDWAMTQNNLAAALAEQAIRTDGPKGAHLLAQAVTAYRAALEVRTREDHPVDWAMTQNNLAIAQLHIASHDSCENPARALTDALTAVDLALTVYDPVHLSYDHGTATRLRDAIQSTISGLT